jgi:type III restriction enzyme
MRLHDFQLLSFQQKAVDQTIDAIYRYDASKNLFTLGGQIPSTLEGKPKPYLHRIKAITGAGKTPMLAAISAHLKNSIILWTTPRGAVIEQTTENLKGRYRNLLGSDTEVFGLNEALKNAAWNRIIEKSTGCTIITTTVAAFNQKDGKNLSVHKGDPSPWQQLCEEVKRSIWVFYDEGHNATENQFTKLLELQPKGFVLASASPLAADLQILLPGEDKEAKESVLNNSRTTVIDTKEVVAAGLLKRTIEIHDLDTGGDKILEAAYEKRKYLESISDDKNIIACYIVDRDAEGTGVLHGLYIWERLIAAGANPTSIAVHLSGAVKAAEVEIARGKSYFKNLRATYDEGLGPNELKNQGFRHLIWNLSLEEGWDEPWAYVGYFHGEQASESKVIQRIGRLVRNPFKDDDGLPMFPTLEPLRSVYCYLNTSDNILKAVVSRLQNEMDTSCREVLVIKECIQEKNTLFVPAKSIQRIPTLSITPDPTRLEKELLKSLFAAVCIDEKGYIAAGKAVTLTINVGSTGNISKSIENSLDTNVPTTIGDVVKHYLTLKDSRLIRKNGSIGAWISPLFWKHEELQRDLHYSSEAYYEFRRRCDTFIKALDALISIDLDNDQDDQFVVESIRLINPDGGDTEEKKKRYKVHSFNNAVHEQYNGLNDLELEIATMLDTCNVIWARNPARTGYGIPLIQSNNASTKFYPDFIVWKGKEVFFIETKGWHLLGEAKEKKLIKLPRGLHLCFITKEYGDYILITRGNHHEHPKHNASVKKLITDFLRL